jgi:hypothetical protein
MFRKWTGLLGGDCGGHQLYRWNMGAKTTCLLLSPHTEGYDYIRFSAEP